MQRTSWLWLAGIMMAAPVGNLRADTPLALVPTAGLVTELGVTEVYEGHLVHLGKLWVTRSRTTDTAPHTVEVYDPSTLQLIKTVNLPHSASYIHAYGENAVVVVGKSATPYWSTHYTVITVNGSTYDARTTTFSDQYQVDYMTTDNRTLYFGEPGERAVYKLRGTRSLQGVGGQISNPGTMVARGNDLWVVERQSYELGDEELVHVDLATGQTLRTIGERNGLTSLAWLEQAPWVAVSETLANQVLFVDRETNALAHTVVVKGGPRGITQLGGCAVVASTDPKLVTFISLWGDAPAVMAQWDLRDVDDRLKAPRSIAVDPVSKRVFLRSTYLCSGCSSTQSSVFYAQEDGGETFAQCLEHGVK